MKINEKARAGEPISADQAEAIRRSIAVADFEVTPPIERINTVAGTHLRLNKPEPFWALLSGNSSPYGWTEAKTTSAGWTSCCRSGKGAYEVNGIGGLGGTHALLFPGFGGVDWRFQAVRSGAGGSGSGSVNLCWQYTVCTSSGTDLTQDELQVTITSPSGTTPPTPKITKSAGQLQVCIVATAKGAYSCKVSGSDFVPHHADALTTDLSSDLNASITLTPALLDVYVKGCNSTALPNATVQVTAFGNNSTGTTDSNGFVALPIASEWDGVSNDWGLVVSHTGFTTVHTPDNLGDACPAPSMCNCTITLIEAPCRACVGNCEIPICESGVLNTPWGSCPIDCTGHGSIVAMIPAATAYKDSTGACRYTCNTGPYPISAVTLHFFLAGLTPVGRIDGLIITFSACRGNGIPLSDGTDPDCAKLIGGEGSAQGQITNIICGPPGTVVYSVGSGRLSGTYTFTSDNSCEGGSYGGGASVQAQAVLVEPTSAPKIYYCQDCPLRGSGRHCSIEMCREAARKVASSDTCRRDEPLHREDAPRSTKAKLEIVVAKYREDVSWVAESPYPVVVYDKCPGSTLDLNYGDQVIFRRLPNVGREAHTYLAHIVENYRNLADWTVFVQGQPHNRSMAELWGRAGATYVDSCSLTAEYAPDFPSDLVKVRDMIEHHGGYEVRYGVVDPTTPGHSDAARMSTESLWRTYFACPLPSPMVFGYSAQWIVPRKRITDRPLAFWQHCLNACSQSDNVHAQGPASAWAFEMIFKYLFSDNRKFPVRAFPGTTTWTAGEVKMIQGKPKGCGCGK